MLAAADVHAPGHVRGAAARGILCRARRAGRRRDAPCAEGAGCRWVTGIHHFAGKGNSPRKDGTVNLNPGWNLWCFRTAHMPRSTVFFKVKTILCESISPHAFASSFLHRTHRIPITTTLAAKMAIRPFSGSSRPDVSAIAPTSTGAVIPPIL